MATSTKLRLTSQKALTMALDYISNKMEIKDVYLNEKYGLNRCTLCKIRRGEDVPRSHKDYMHVFIRILNEHRKACAQMLEYEKANHITNLLRDMLLVEYDMPTDREIISDSNNRV